jgi:hypothetical protein
MRRTLIFVFLLGLCLAPALRAQQALPDHFGDWSASAPAAKTAVEAPGKPSGEAVAILNEAGLDGVTRRAYASSGRTLTLTLYQLHDPSGAYSAFTYLRTTEMADSDLAEYAAVGRDTALLLSGASLVEARGLAGASLADLRELAAALARTADKTPLPPIRTYLPLRGKLSGSEKYFLGPAGLRAEAAALGKPEIAALADKAGFASGAEVILARYRIGREESVVLLFEYPTPQAAGLHQKHIETALSSVAPPAELPLRRKGSLLSLVLAPAAGAPSRAGQATAQALLDGVRYETDVTWNEKSQSLTDAPWPVMVVNTILGTGAILVVAIVFGVAFGGVRILTKLFFPGKVFDRASQMQILQLGINSKPIDSNDFYASWNPRS